MHSLTPDVWLRSLDQPAEWIGLLVTLGGYGIGVGRLWAVAGRGRGVSTRQVALYTSGVVLLALALLSPLDVVSDDLFSAHMVQHLLLISVAAPLLVLGAPGVAWLWVLPRSWRSALGHWWGLRRGARGALALLGIPAVAWMLHALALAVWHVPAMYDLALANEGVHAAEHLSFLLTACLFWWLVLPGPGGRRLGYGAGVLYVTAMAAVMGVYGAVLTFAAHPWYGGYAGRTAAWGLTPLADQQLAGLIMWIPTSVIYLGAALWCFAEWLRVDERRHDLDHSLPRLLGAPPPAVAGSPVSEKGLEPGRS